MIAIFNKIVNKQCGFITEEDAETLAPSFPVLQVLVRTGANRYVCGLEHLKEVFEIVEGKGDYVRDVGLTAENCERIKSGMRPFTMSRIRQVHPDN